MALQPVLKPGVSLEAMGTRPWQPECFVSLAPPCPRAQVRRRPWMAGGLAGVGWPLSSLLPGGRQPCRGPYLSPGWLACGTGAQGKETVPGQTLRSQDPVQLYSSGPEVQSEGVRGCLTPGFAHSCAPASPRGPGLSWASWPVKSPVLWGFRSPLAPHQ